MSRRQFCELGHFLLKQREAGSLLLLGHTDSATATAGGFGVLTTHTQTEKDQTEGEINQTGHLMSF